MLALLAVGEFDGPTALRRGVGDTRLDEISTPLLAISTLMVGGEAVGGLVGSIFQYLWSAP